MNNNWLEDGRIETREGSVARSCAGGALAEMTKGKMPNLPGQPVSLGEARGRLLWGRWAHASVKFHRGIAFVIIADILLWAGMIAFWRVVLAQ